LLKRHEIDFTCVENYNKKVSARRRNTLNTDNCYYPPSFLYEKTQYTLINPKNNLFEVKKALFSGQKTCFFYTKFLQKYKLFCFFSGKKSWKRYFINEKHLYLSPVKSIHPRSLTYQIRYTENLQECHR